MPGCHDKVITLGTGDGTSCCVWLLPAGHRSAGAGGTKPLPEPRARGKLGITTARD